MTTMTDTRTRPGDALLRADKIVFERSAEWEGRWWQPLNRLKLKMIIAEEIEAAVLAEQGRVDAIVHSMTGLDPEAPVREVGNMLKASRRLGMELPAKREIDRYQPYGYGGICSPPDSIHSPLLSGFTPDPHHPSHSDSSAGLCDGGSSDTGGGDCGSSSDF